MVTKFIAVDLYRQNILLESSSHAELNREILNQMDLNQRLPQAMWLYKMDESLLLKVKQEMQQSKISFAMAMLPYKKFGGRS